MRTPEDKLIIESFLRDRTEESFFPLFAAYCPPVRRFFLLHGLDIQAAEDLSQDVFLKVYTKANELRDAERFSGWVYAIARNVLISHWRRQKSRIAEAELEPVTNGLSESLIAEAQAAPKLQLMEWLEELEPCEQDLVILRFVEGLSYKELAEALQAPVGTIKWRISEVRRKLLFVIRPSSSFKRQRRAANGNH
jgi:RNA polymerase sigma-70 factor, ECF subfamily